MDLYAARQERDKAVERAADNADRVIDGWSGKALGILLDYLRIFGGNFMAEDVRKYAHEVRGLEAPPDQRAWGGAFLRAEKRGIIRRTGYAPMKSKNCHANPKTVWAAA